MKEKSDKHVDRLVRFRRSVDGAVETPSGNDQTIQELIMVPMFFSFPEGGSVQ